MSDIEKDLDEILDEMLEETQFFYEYKNLILELKKTMGFIDELTENRFRLCFCMGYIFAVKEMENIE